MSKWPELSLQFFLSAKLQAQKGCPFKVGLQIKLLVFLMRLSILNLQGTCSVYIKCCHGINLIYHRKSQPFYSMARPNWNCFFEATITTGTIVSNVSREAKNWICCWFFEDSCESEGLGLKMLVWPLPWPSHPNAGHLGIQRHAQSHYVRRHDCFFSQCLFLPRPRPLLNYMAWTTAHLKTITWLGFLISISLLLYSREFPLGS